MNHSTIDSTLPSAVTISLSEQRSTQRYPTLDAVADVHKLLNRPVEQMHCETTSLVSCDTQHALVKAAHDAFYDHHALVLRPDDVWFCIMQGLAHHVNANVETLRHLFVSHEGKKRLVVTREDFLLGQWNPWPQAFAAFSEQVAEHVGPLRDFVGVRFSTTTSSAAAAFDVCLMDGFHGYFEYEMRCGCGIPEIVLHGTAQDWRAIIPLVRQLACYGLSDWCDSLIPVLERIAESAQGAVNPTFWRSFFRYEAGSGPAEMTGWILTLFPYLLDGPSGEMKPSPYLTSWKACFEQATARKDPRALMLEGPKGPHAGSVAQSLASAPVRLIDQRTGEQADMRFVAGLFGVEQSPTSGALAPVFGWAVVRDTELRRPPRCDRIEVDFDPVTGEVIAVRPTDTPKT